MLHLHTLWFVLIAILWVGFFVLEGFDFGVGALHTLVGRNESERRVAINTIGPWWDGNEVWLIVAGASMFAAFPAWYGTMFSALYLALLILLAALMARGVAFEFRGKHDDPRWRRTWTWCTGLGSMLIPLLLGVGLGDLLNGLPIDSSHDFTGNFFDLLTPFGIWTGLTLLSLCLLHGASFLALRTADGMRARAQALAGRLGWIASAFVVGFVIWTLSVVGHKDVPDPVQVLAVLAVVFAARLASTASNGWAFTCSAVAIAASVGSLFIELYPNVMVSSTNAAYSLTVDNSASGHYALVVMTVVAVLFLPLVLLYQGWSFHVFRGRLKAPPEASTASGHGRTPRGPDADEQPPAPVIGRGAQTQGPG
jgi:cytochrome bd-type quinol oxidase subunit 2